MISLWRAWTFKNHYNYTTKCSKVLFVNNIAQRWTELSPIYSRNNNRRTAVFCAYRLYMTVTTEGRVCHWLHTFYLFVLLFCRSYYIFSFFFFFFKLNWVTAVLYNDLIWNWWEHGLTPGTLTRLSPLFTICLKTELPHYVYPFCKELGSGRRVGPYFLELISFFNQLCTLG